MTLSIQKSVSMPLEAEYSRLRKQQSDSNNSYTNRAINVAVETTTSNSQIDTVTLTSRQTDSGIPSKLKPSQSVTTAEKKALQAQFSVYA